MFKGFVGTGKTIAIIKGGNPHSRNVSVFEGFPDFLTLLTMRGVPQLEDDAILLFSTALKRRAVEHINTHGYEAASLYLDHDTAGRKTTMFMQSELSVANLFDKSVEYHGHNDLSAWWSGVGHSARNAPTATPEAKN